RVQTLDPTNVSELEGYTHRKPQRMGQGGRRKSLGVQVVYKNIRDIERQSGRRGFGLVHELQRRNIPMPLSLRMLGGNWQQAYKKAPTQVRNYFYRARKSE